MHARDYLVRFIANKLNEIKTLFERKNGAYGAEDDVFWNFRQTALRKFGSALPPAMFDVAYILADKHWVALGKGIDVALAKGRRVLVEGRLQIRSYEDNTGQRRRIAEVIAQSVEFLDNSQGNGAGGSTKQNQGGGADFGNLGTDVFPDEEIPF